MSLTEGSKTDRVPLQAGAVSSSWRRRRTFTGRTGYGRATKPAAATPGCEAPVEWSRGLGEGADRRMEGRCSMLTTASDDDCEKWASELLGKTRARSSASSSSRHWETLRLLHIFCFFFFLLCSNGGYDSGRSEGSPLTVTGLKCADSFIHFPSSSSFRPAFPSRPVSVSDGSDPIDSLHLTSLLSPSSCREMSSSLHGQPYFWTWACI